jgi:putative acetyltransferase
MMLVTVTIREEQPEDIEAIRYVNQTAFGQHQESRLVDTLRANGGILLSLVAIHSSRVVGYILYSPAIISSGSEIIYGSALGPVAVLPELQRQGIGSELIVTGNQKMREADFPFIVVLGHSEYYPRFGFEPARSYGIKCEWDVPDNLFMIMVMDMELSRFRGISGVVKYRPEFNDFT